MDCVNFFMGTTFAVLVNDLEGGINHAGLGILGEDFRATSSRRRSERSSESLKSTMGDL